MSLVAIFPTGFWMSTPFKTGVWHQMLKEITIAKCSESSVLCGITKTRFCGKLIEPSREEGAGILSSWSIFMLQFQHEQWSVFAMSAILNFMHLVCALLDIAPLDDFFSRLEVFRSAADQLHLSLGGVSTMSQVCLRSILFKPKSCICSNTFHRCHLFLKDWILHWIPALAVHGVILDWLLGLYVHRVRYLFHGFRFDEAFFKQSFQPLFFLQITGFSCFWKGFYAVVLLLCHFIFIKIFRKPRRLIEPKELIHCLSCFSH